MRHDAPFIPTTYLYFFCFLLFLSKEPESPPIEMNSLVTLENFMKVLVISYLVSVHVQVLQTRIFLCFIIYNSLIFSFQICRRRSKSLRKKILAFVIRLMNYRSNCSPYKNQLTTEVNFPRYLPPPIKLRLQRVLKSLGLECDDLNQFRAKNTGSPSLSLSILNTNGATKERHRFPSAHHG